MTMQVSTKVPGRGLTAEHVAAAAVTLAAATAAVFYILSSQGITGNFLHQVHLPSKEGMLALGVGLAVLGTAAFVSCFLLSESEKRRKERLEKLKVDHTARIQELDKQITELIQEIGATGTQEAQKAHEAKTAEKTRLEECIVQIDGELGPQTDKDTLAFPEGAVDSKTHCGKWVLKAVLIVSSIALLAIAATVAFHVLNEVALEKGWSWATKDIGTAFLNRQPFEYLYTAIGVAAFLGICTAVAAGCMSTHKKLPV